MKSFALLVFLLACLPASAQKKPAEPTSPLCTRETAVDTAKQQILITRTFDSAIPRITVLIRAADLLWPHDQEKALAAFTESFDLAVQHYKEVGEQTRRLSQSQFAGAYALPDQRFKVINALAKRDPARARKLAEQVVQGDTREAAERAAANDQTGQKNAEKLLGAARLLTETDPTAAATFARASLRYPATLYLASFFYTLAKVNKTADEEELTTKTQRFY